MIHYSCDRCGRAIDPKEELRYVVRVEVEAVTEDEMTRGEFPVGFTNHAEVLTGNKTEKGMVASLLVRPFPG